MGRTLPWLKRTTSTKPPNAASTERPAKRQRTLNFRADSDSDTSTTHPAPPPPRRNDSDRAPSSSPPPTSSAPPAPPSIEYMRPGLAHDDIYIMVEDEFLSTARTFTSHLHHAEYQRLKRLSKTRPPATNRRVDSITQMREETKRQKEAEAREKRTKGLLEKLNGGVNAKRGQEEESDLEDLESDDRGDAPGVGTALGELMKRSPRKNITSLSGLHGIKSSTRAAAGYERPKNLSDMSHSRSNIFKEFGRIEGAKKSSTDLKKDEPETDDADSDDLDAPAPKKRSDPIDPVKRMDFGERTKPRKFSKPSTSTSEVSKPGRSRSPSPSPIHKSREAVLDRLKRRERERKEKEKSHLDIDEIPIFLV
ncbi:MAG: hypothetical protein Q9191_003769 [Dirinaria sp. TL-2023a]